MFPLELKEGRTLLQIQAYRIRKLQELAGNGCSVPWYIMTSGPTKEPTVAFLQENSFFGLNPDDVIIFEQATIPCLTTDGKMILGTKSSLSRAPDGNGGIYFAVRCPYCRLRHAWAPFVDARAQTGYWTLESLITTVGCHPSAPSRFGCPRFADG